MLIFLIVGIVGLALLVASVVLSDVLDGALDAIGLDFGGLLSTTTIAAFAAAFGFGGVLAMYSGTGAGPAAAVGVAAGLAVGIVAGFVTRTLQRGETSATPSAGNAIGASGVVVTGITAGSYGEVRIRYDGQVVKLNARADTDLVAGESVVVTESLSPTSVRVAPTRQSA